MGFVEKITSVWQKVSVIQRALLVAVVLTVVMVVALLAYWARLPDMRMLYAELAPEEAAKITDKIAEKNIPYELRNGGTSIYVPKQNIYQLRLDMAKDGLPAGQHGGYSIFDKEKIGISPFVQNVNLQRALQDELAKSIQMIEGVVHARVHIVSTEQTLFNSSQGQTSASAVLQLKPGYQLGGQTVAAIAYLVAGSIEGLKSENVTIVDSDGRLLRGEGGEELAGGASTVQDYKERVEQNLAEKVERMLTAVLGPGRATVRVSAEVDMTSTNLVTEKYDPVGKVASKEEITSNSEIEQSTATAEGAPTAPGNTKRDETIVTEYLVGKSVEQRVDLPGEIKSLSVAAVVDLSPADVNEAEQTQAAKIMELADVERLIENALGLDPEGSDSLKVVEARFYRPTESLAEEDESGGLNYIAIAKNGSLGLMAICALLVLKILKGAKKKATAAVSEGTPQLAGLGETAGLLPGSEAGSQTVLVRRQLAEVLRHNPDQAKRLFLSWLQEKNK